MASQNGPRPYAAGMSSNDPKQLPLFINNELQRIQAALQLLAQSPTIPPTYVAPTKPREGDLALAAGHIESADHWSPDASGLRKLYQYRMTSPGAFAWVKIG